MKSIHGKASNEATEGDERNRTAVPAPGTDPAYEELDDAIHIAAPWEPRQSLCGQWNCRNLAPRDARPDPWSGCWSCLKADDWLLGRIEQLRGKAAT